MAGWLLRAVAAAAAGLLVAVVPMAGHRPGAFAQATTSTDAQAQLDAVLARIRTETAARDSLRSQLSDLLARIDGTRANLERAQTQAVATSDAIGRLSARIDQQQRDLDRQAALAYEGQPASVLDALLSSSSLSDLSDRVQFLASTARSQRELIDNLSASRGELDRQRAALHDAQGSLAAADAQLQTEAEALSAQLALHERTLASLASDQAAAEALLAKLSAPSGGGSPPPSPPPSPSPSPTPSPGPTDPGPEAVMAMIRADFAPLGSATVSVALCVADKESSFNPLAENPVTGAEGVYQFIPSTWASLSAAAGWGGASAFDAQANVGVAAWTVTNFAWSNWSTTAAECGA